MEKEMVIVFIFFLVFSFVSSAGWDDIDTQNNSSDDTEIQAINNNSNGNGSSKEVNIADNQGETSSNNNNNDLSNSEMGEGKFTKEFFIAIGVLIAGLLVIIYLIYALLKKPKNKWEK